MNPIWGQVAGVATVILMVAFVAIWAWAWLPRHKRTFDELAKLPLEDEPPARFGKETPSHGDRAGGER